MKKSIRVAFSSHSRRWRHFLYVYPVISRRSKGLSIGVNLNPERTCSFDCVYCQVDRSHEPRATDVDLATLEAELSELLSNRDKIFERKN